MTTTVIDGQTLGTVTAEEAAEMMVKKKEAIDKANRMVKTSTERSVDDLLAEANDDSDDVISKVYLQKGSGTEGMTWLFDFSAGEHNLSSLQKYIQENYGGGNYRLHIRKNGAVKANRLLKIKDLPHLQNPANMSGFSNVLIAEQRATREMLNDFMREKEKPSALSKFLEPEVLIPLVTAAAPALLKLFERPSTADQLKEVQTLLTITKELNGDNKSGEEDKEKGVIDSLANIAEKFAPVILQATNKETQTMQQPATQQSPKNASVTIDATQKQQISTFLMLILNYAKNDDVESALDFMDRTLNDEQFTSVLEYVMHDDYLNIMAQFNKEVLQYPEYFGNLKNAIIAEMTPDNEPETSTESDNSTIIEHE